MNSIPKYVVSSTLADDQATWGKTTVIRGDAAAEIARLKAAPGGDLLVEGSCQLVQMLVQHGLVDEYRLMVFPIIFGAGKRLFPDEMSAAAPPRHPPASPAQPPDPCRGAEAIKRGAPRSGHDAAIIHEPGGRAVRPDSARLGCSVPVPFTAAPNGPLSGWTGDVAGSVGRGASDEGNRGSAYRAVPRGGPLPRAMLRGSAAHGRQRPSICALWSRPGSSRSRCWSSNCSRPSYRISA
jgi:hypothetical protein